MSSRNKSETKYTYKGNKKTDNKYANIFQDLNDKQEIYKSNSLRKMHPKDENEESIEKIDSEKENIKKVTSEEAEQNALKRKQAMKNEKIIATQKSSPVIHHKSNSEFDRIESIERLKREKRASKDDDMLNDFSTKELDLSNLPDDFDKTIVFDEISGESIYNNPKVIREEAKKRVNMDKSNVEIYKEYSDFERINKEKNAMKNDNKKTEKNENRSYDFENTNEFDKENLSYEEQIRQRESEIEELIRRMRQDSKIPFDERKRNKRASQKNEKYESNEKESRILGKKIPKRSLSDYRADVYKKNSEKNEARFDFKKFGIVVIVVLLVVLFASAAIDKILTDRKKVSNNKPKITVTKDGKKDKKPKNKTETKDDKKKKLEAIKSKLNVDESERLDYIIENINSYPDNMVDLLIRNPETIDYVYSYKDREKYNNKKLSSNISSSYYVDGSVPLFLQWDRRWGYRSYGNEYVGLTGCGPTSLAMVIRHFDRESGVNPYDIAKYSQDNGYLSKDNFTSWSLFEKGLGKFGLESKDVVPVEAKLKKSIDEGNILIASVKPGVFTERGHIIVIKGYNKNGDFLINDPNSIINTNKSWSFDELKNEIRKIWAINEIGAKPNVSYNRNESNNNTDEDEDDRGTSEDPSIIKDIN